MWIFGLLLCGLGVAYAFHKDNQKFTGMRQEAVRTGGRGMYEPLDTRSIANKHYREIKRYFEERYNYYMNNRDYMYENTNLKRQVEQIPYYKSRNYKYVKAEEFEQMCAGYLAREDVIKKYAPNYLKRENCCDEQLYKLSSNVVLSDIARALTRIEMYKMGFKPAHMHTMQSPLYGDNLYHLDAIDMGGYDEQPSECDYHILKAEGELKHNLVSWNEQFAYERKAGK